jgi:predicted outer membrane repeat protein
MNRVERTTHRIAPAPRARWVAGVLLALAGGASAGPLIVGGQPSAQWPAAGAVVFTTDTRTGTCTGSAITPRWVLTAAHCVTPATIGASPVFQFIVGPDDSAPGAVAYAVDEAVFDPAFDPGHVQNGHDVGLLHIKDVDLPVLPLKLNSKPLTADVIGSSVVVLGYGVTSGGGNDTGKKRIAEITIDSLDTDLIGASQATPGTCGGDSGGPAFVYDADGFPLVIATTSFGDGTCQAGSDYSRVDAALPFITATVGAGLCLDGQACDGIRRNDFDGDLALADGCYVSAGATGANGGASWADAYTDLQSALGNAACKHIRVAAGIYKPTAGNDRTATFHIAGGVRVYGGFAGIRTVRDPMLHATVLSGDIDDNDVNDGGVVTDWTHIVGANSYHVAMLDGTTTAIGFDTQLDGLTITAGDANEAAAPDDRGGALYCNGAGVGHSCNPTLSNLVFAGNFAVDFGGALYADGTDGGNSSPLVRESTFFGNHADVGGGACHDTGASGDGESSPTYVNDTFTTNHARYGGALYHHIESGAGSLSLTNSTFSANISLFGGGAIAEIGIGGGPLIGVANSIFWGDTGPAGSEELIVVADALPQFANSVVKGSGGSASWNFVFGVDKGGNLDSDPLLGPLQDNGGATPTFLPGIGSSAIDGGADIVCTVGPALAHDQRDVARPQGAHCDIGSVEVLP